MGEQPNINVRGRKQLDEFYPGIKRGMALPCIHNHIIEINGDDAKLDFIQSRGIAQRVS